MFTPYSPNVTGNRRAGVSRWHNNTMKHLDQSGEPCVVPVLPARMLFDCLIPYAELLT